MWLLVLGVLGAAAMGIDKGRAERGQWRIKERTLYVIAFMGGFWGILLASELSNHKTSKLSFLAVAYAATIIWALALSRVAVSAGCLS